MSAPSDLVRLTEAAQMLAEAKTLPEIARVRILADRLRDYAKAARLGLDAQNSAAAIAIEAEAKAGDLLRRMEAEGTRRGRSDGRSEQVSAASTPAPATLEDLGVTRNESATWQAVASVPAETRARYITAAAEREVEVTRTGLLRHAGVKAPKAPPSTRPVDDLEITPVHAAKFPDVVASQLTADLAAAIAAVRTDRLDPAKWADAVDRMRPEDVEYLRSKVNAVHRWAESWDRLLAPRPLKVVGGGS